MTDEQKKLIMSVDSLRNWDKNPRAIKKDRFEELKKRIQRHGQFKPLIVTPDGEVLGGNMRLRAYRELGIDDIWVSVVEPKSEAEKIEIALADNEEMGYYEDQALAELIAQYEDDIDLSKYSVHLEQPKSLDEILQEFSPDEIVEDEAPAVSDEEPESKLGEVYQLGRHRLMCGDATKIEDVEKLMDGKKADMVFTDPPYGYSYESNHQSKHKQLLNDDRFLDFLPLQFSNSQDNSAHYVCCSWQTVDVWKKLMEENGFNIKNMIVWKKNNWSMGDLTGAYAGQHELILFAHKGRVTLENGRDRDVWEFDRVPPTEHPTMKPVSLVAKAINNHMSNIVLDLFGGSGSTLIACEQTNRTCYMMELDPKYCDVIRKRYAKFIDRENDWLEVTPQKQ